MEPYLQYELPLLGSIPFNAQEKIGLYNYVKVRPFKKKEKILEVGEKDTHFNFVHKGLARQYYVFNKHEINTQFATKDDMLCSGYSYFSRTASEYFIEAVEPTTLLSISLEDMDTILMSSENFLKWGRLLVNQILFYKELREKELLNYDALNRLKHFMETKPDLFLRLPQIYIASYLNIQPETFSKLKSSIKKTEHQLNKII
jgi:CRP-like cAMP-binding protein